MGEERWEDEGFEDGREEEAAAFHLVCWAWREGMLYSISILFSGDARDDSRVTAAVLVYCTPTTNPRVVAISSWKREPNSKRTPGMQVPGSKIGCKWAYGAP